MRDIIVKTGCVISVIGIAVSATGCFGLGKSDKNMKALQEEIDKADFVEEWSGDIPDGMEVMYVLTKNKSVSTNDNLDEYEYEYDDQGRQVVSVDIREKGYIRLERTYDENGLIIRKAQSHDGYVGSAPFNDCEYLFDYNDNGQLISYTYKSNDKTEKYEFAYEDGHLISRSDNGTLMMEYDYSFDTAPYYESVVIVEDSYGAEPPSVLTRYYDEDGLIISQGDDDHTVTYVYENGEIVRSIKENRSGTFTYSASGKYLETSLGGGREVTTYEYNDYDDLVYYSVERDGEINYEKTVTYTYDADGNKTSRVENIRSVYDGKESNYGSTTTYTYDHGLLVVEAEDGDNGKLACSTNVYYYKAILVPATEV